MESGPGSDWRRDERTVRPWGWDLVAAAVISLGVAILAGGAVTSLWHSTAASSVATGMLLLGMLVPVIIAFTRSRPDGLLRFRAVDVAYGLVLGGLLRLTQGWVEIAVGGSGAWPSYPLVDGRVPASWWLEDALLPGLVAPVVEEFFFRAVLVVALYTVLRRTIGLAAAAWVAVLMSTGIFVLVHGTTVGPSADQVIALILLGLTCSLLVVLTGRIWGAVLVHTLFNLSYVALAAVGTMLR